MPTPAPSTGMSSVSKDDHSHTSTGCIAMPSVEMLRKLGMGDIERGKDVFKARAERHFGKGKVPAIVENA